MFIAFYQIRLKLDTRRITNNENKKNLKKDGVKQRNHFQFRQ